MKKTLRTLLRGLIIATSLVGLIEMLGIRSGHIKFEQLIFYTIQSNLVILIAYSYMVYKSVKNKKTFELKDDWYGAITLMIVVTGLIYNFVLAPTIPSTSEYSANSLSNILAHITTPLFVFLEWFFFARKKDLNWKSPFKWIGIPMVYWLYTILRAPLGPIATMKNGSTILISSSILPSSDGLVSLGML